MDEHDAFPPEFGRSFCNRTSRPWDGKSRPVCAEMAWRRVIAADTRREGRPRTKELNLEARQHGVGVSREVERVTLCARVHHEKGN